MPLSELYRMGKEKLDGSNDPSSGREDEFVELVWENGQVMMQGQSSRTRKAPNKPRDNVGNGSNTKYGKFGVMDCALNEFHIPGLNQDDDLVPWLNYPIDKSLQNGYCSDFMTELSGVTVNEASTQNQLSSIGKRYIDIPTRGVVSSGQGNASNVSSSQQCQTSFPPHRPKASDCNHISDSPTVPTTENGFSGMRPRKPDPVPPSRSPVLMNFSHFSRPAALVKTSSSCQPDSVPQKANLRLSQDIPVEERVSITQSALARQEKASKEDKNSNQVAESSIKGLLDVEKVIEPVVACSSVCSGNSVEKPTDDVMHNSKRKFCDIEDSECPSEDVEEESMELKRAARARAGTSSKRSRAAEVHNLSERRRRDRINEKMRALQELIPNCNKVDKASMLDEAIEYLKTLQVQVQIMSVGAGLYMPPMMMPHMGHFSPLVGMGMGMGMQYGMGMPDMNAGSSGFPMLGSHFPLPPMSAPSAMHGIAGSNLQFHGPPTQGLPVPMSRAPPIPLSAGPPMKSAVEHNPGAVTNSSMNQTSTQRQTTNEDFDPSPLLQNNGQAANAKAGKSVNNAH